MGKSKESTRHERAASDEPKRRLPVRPASGASSGKPKRQPSYDSGLRDIAELEESAHSATVPPPPPPRRPSEPLKSALSKTRKKDPDPKRKSKKRTGSDASLSSRHTSSNTTPSPSEAEGPTGQANAPRKIKIKKKKKKGKEAESGKAVKWSEDAPVGRDSEHAIVEWVKPHLWQKQPDAKEKAEIWHAEAERAKKEEFEKALAYRKLAPSERYKEDIKDIREYAREVSNRMNNGHDRANPPLSSDYEDAVVNGGHDPTNQIRLGTQVRATSLRLRHVDRPIPEILRDVDALERILTGKPKSYFDGDQYKRRYEALRETRLMLYRQTQAVQGDEYWDKIDGHSRLGGRKWTPSLPLMDPDDDDE